MGQRGPAPKPTQQKKLQGTYREDRANPGEVFPSAPDSVDAPPFLDGEAKDKWYATAPMLQRNGLLTECDLDTLAIYYQTWARYVEAESKLSTDGATTVARSGYQQVSAWVTIATRADLLKLGDRLGLNPSARGRISVEQKDDGDELLA